MILASARLVDVYRFGYAMPNWRDKYPTEECARGRIETGWFGWILEDVRELELPIHFRGQLGLRAVPVDVLACVDRDLVFARV